jgi:hypothetical protein
MQLADYRSISCNFAFLLGGSTLEGLPSRVYTTQRPEMTPNVQLYTEREYPRVAHAKKCRIKASLAMPIMMPSTNEVIAVLEVSALSWSAVVRRSMS